MHSKLGFAIVGIVTLATASAFGAATEKSKNFGGSSGGSSGGGSASGGAAASGGGAGAWSNDDVSRDTVHEDGEEASKPKWWTIEANAEYHRLVRQSDLNGDAVNKNFDYYLLGAQFDPTDRDRIVVRTGMYERMIADEGETGLRLDDALISYTRLFPLPQKINLRAQVRTAIPLSYESKLQGLITAPRGAIYLERQFGPVDVLLMGFFEGYINRYKEAQGGSANPTMRVGSLVEADVTMPFHKPLMVGADFYEASTWFYTPNGAPPPGSGVYGSTVDSQFPNGQPVSQIYGGEIFVRYRLPPLFNALADVQVAYANGDPVLGYQSSLHDGVTRFNAFYRHVAEVYFALNARY